MQIEVWLVQFPDGRVKRFRQRAHESRAEFSGRAWCEIEAVLGRGAGDPPVPAGTQITLDHRAYAKAPSCEAEVFESTGEPYANRWRCLGRAGRGTSLGLTKHVKGGE